MATNKKRDTVNIISILSPESMKESDFLTKPFQFALACHLLFPPSVDSILLPNNKRPIIFRRIHCKLCGR